MINNDIDEYAYEILRAFALTHNYNKWIYELFKPYLGKNILEVGCGIGNMSRYFMKSCEKLICIDTSKNFLEHLKIDYPKLELCNYDISNSEVLFLKKKDINTIVCINVLEHVEDDRKALENMLEILLPNGYLLLFVPALSFLYGSIDSYVSHFRRYNKKDLEEKVKGAGFTVEKIFFSNLLGMFGWFINSRIFRRKRFPVIQPILYDKIVPIISIIEKCIKPPIGMTLIVIAKKNK